MKYFWNDTAGLNSDIERHIKEEKNLLAKIEALESIEERNALQNASLRTYRNFLCQLMQSKADTVNKLGRK